MHEVRKDRFKVMGDGEAAERTIRVGIHEKLTKSCPDNYYYIS